MKRYLSRNKKIQNIIIILTIALFSSFFIFENNPKISLILIGISLLILVFSVLEKGIKKKIKIGKYHLLIAIFMLYCILSSIWSVYPERALGKGITIFQILICFSILYNYYARSYSSEKLLLCIAWSSVCVALYTIYFAGISFILSGLLSGRRLEVDFANINSISGVVALGMVILFYYIFYEKKYKYFLFFILDILIIVASGSRKSLFLLIIGCFLIIMIKNLKNKNFILNIVKMIICGIIFCVIIKLILELPVFDIINTRINGLIASLIGRGKADNSALVRKSMIILGWEQFKKTPFLGVGIGNSGPVILAGTKYNNSYLHNNFIELLACGGVIGFLIYYNIYFYIFYS